MFQAGFIWSVSLLLKVIDELVKEIEKICDMFCFSGEVRIICVNIRLG